MARAEKIVVELSPRDRRLLKDIVDALTTKVSVSLDTLQQMEKPKVSPDHPGLKRLTEPAYDPLKDGFGSVAHDSYIPTGEGDWQLQNEQKVGEDD